MRSETADIVFVFPPAHGNAGVFKTHLGSAYLRASLAHQGIATAQYLNENPDTVAIVAADILAYRPRIVGFTVYDANFPLSLALARDLKRQQPDVQIVFGGPTATFGATQILEKHPVVDACVVGEAEETGAKIFASLLAGNASDDAPAGVALRKDGAVVSPALPPLVGCNSPDVQSALDTTPSPYLSGILTDGRAGVLTGRGCTHHCQYCCFAALGRKKLRLHSIDRVMAELECIAEHQKRTDERYIVAIHDDTFTLLPARAKTLCQRIADRNLGLVLSCITRADALDDELLRLMREAGFVSLAFGLESAVPSVLRATGKVRPPDWPHADLEPERQFVEQVRTSVLGAKKHGFNVGVSIILGLPTETADDGAATLRFVKDLPVDFYMHNFLWVFPGTPLWETHDQYGIRCTLNPMGLPTTYEYAYDVAKLRPRPRCSLEQDAQFIRLLTADALFACQPCLATKEGIGVVILNVPEFSSQTTEWLGQVLSVGGIVIQVYPPLKRSEEALRLYNDRTTFGDSLVPARHHVQLVPKPDQGTTQRWLVACSGVDLYAPHKPSLLSIRSSNEAAPLADWIKGVPTTCALCEISDYLRQPDELIRFLDESSEENSGTRLQQMRVPPGIKYPGRWLKGNTPCLSLTRIEVNAQGEVRCCAHGESIGRVGDSRESLAKRLNDFARAAELRRGCAECPNSHCPRCLFPGISDQAYCNIMTKQTRVLEFLNQIGFYSRLPLILENQRDRMGTD